MPQNIKKGDDCYISLKVQEVNEKNAKCIGFDNKGEAFEQSFPIERLKKVQKKSHCFNARGV